MRKEELKKLRTLNATKTMMEMAKQDLGKSRKGYWGGIQYQYGIYMRCQILQGIMKIAIFLVEEMKRGDKTPAYELFINPETADFVTYDVSNDKWRNAKLDMLEWPRYVYDSGKYINREGNHSIITLLGVKHGGYRGILEYQQDIRREQLKQKYRRETDPWDLDMEQIPEEPKDFKHWINKTAIKQHYIFYEYDRKGAKEGYCTWCEKTVPIRNPRNNEYATCKCCGRKIQYKSKGKAGNFSTDKHVAYLIQKCEDGFVIRRYSCRRVYKKNEYERASTYFSERARTIYDDTRVLEKTYCWELYKQQEERWVRGSHHCYESEGTVYKRTIPSLAKKELSRTGLPEIIRAGVSVDPIKWLKDYGKCEYVETLSKAGLFSLAKNIDLIKGEANNITKGDLAKRLGIDRSRMQRLRKNDGGYAYLQWLRKEKEKNTIIQDKVLMWFVENGIDAKDVDFISGQMGEISIKNYLEKQFELYKTSWTGWRECRITDVLSDWTDYISMAKKCKMRTDEEGVYKPRDLREAHDKAGELMKFENLKKFANELIKKYPEAAELCTDLKKYEYSDKKFAILAPEGILDIVSDASVLGHCVSWDERYIERMSRKETFILFLRRREDESKPWYTLEVEPGGVVRQKRTTGNNLLKDFDEAVSFVKKWQSEIQKRINQEDKKLAEESKKLRNEGFEEMRKNNVIIRRGRQEGMLLADVLESDLMEVV